jgi:predicted small lipoprotein YifL
MRRTLVITATVALATLAGCGTDGTTPQPQSDGTVNSSVKIADNGSYGTYLDKHTFDGRTVTCLIVRTKQTTSITCDWTAK